MARIKTKTEHYDLSVCIPTALSAEEKKLKELQEKYKEWKKKLSEKKPPPTEKESGTKESKKSKRTMEEGEEATHELIKKVQSGAITMKKSGDRIQYKRSRLNSDRQGEEGEIVDPFEDDSEIPANVLWRQRRAESSSNNTQRTLYIRGFDLQKESLGNAFGKFGEIKRINLGDRQRHAFIEFLNAADAESALKEMDGNMVNGITVRVSYARRQGGDF